MNVGTGNKAVQFLGINKSDFGYSTDHRNYSTFGDAFGQDRLSLHRLIMP
jgi:hypothetical protein